MKSRVGEIAETRGDASAVLDLGTVVVFSADGEAGIKFLEIGVLGIQPVGHRAGGIDADLHVRSESAPVGKDGKPGEWACRGLYLSGTSFARAVT
jgi:hypothetical protein